MALSVMMQHYFSVKEKYKGCIIFYRLGDFYEMFFDDAIKASSLLDLTLTGRDCGLEERAPMCGIPFHAADVYISKLVELGEKVAICEQLTEPNGKDLVERDVIRVVTAGTVTNNELIDEHKNNFLCSVFLEKNTCALSWVDITTGELYTKEIKGENLYEKISDALVKIAPAEIISNKEGYEVFSISPLIEHGVLVKFSLFTESEYNINSAIDALKEQFGTTNLQVFNIKENDIVIRPTGALISYLKLTQKHSLINIKKVIVKSDEKVLMLDYNTVRNLEITKTLHDGKRYGSLLWLLDKTKTSMGARKLSEWLLYPLNNVNDINERLDGVKAFFDNTLVRTSISELFSTIKDIGRISGKIANGNLMPRDCVALSNSLEVLPNVKFNLLGLTSKLVTKLSNEIKDFSDVVSLLKSAINDTDTPANLKEGGYIKNGFDKDLDELRSINKNSKAIIAEIENREREKTGIKNLRISYNHVFGYYIEVTNSFKNLVPYEYKRKQTLANCERYISDELKEVEEKILSSEEKSLKLENEIYNKIRKFLESKIEDFIECSNAISSLDALISLATVAKENNYVYPIITENSDTLELIASRHPVVEKLSKQRFISNDCLLDNSENRTIIITGPNMAGKSTYMRQIAIITLMAHIGSFVPCESAKIPLVDRIFTRIGASDNLISDQSTFMVEMTETANILANATKNSLIVLDEIGRGTSTFDGLSIAWAVVEYINNTIKAKTLFATHYHELTELEGKIEGIKNYKVTVKEISGGIVFLRKIMRGGANRSFGIEVASLSGITKDVTNRAKEILKSLENNDITFNINNEDETVKRPSRIEKTIKELDINKMTPIDAFNTLTELINMVKEENE